MLFTAGIADKPGALFPFFSSTSKNNFYSSNSSSAFLFFHLENFLVEFQRQDENGTWKLEAIYPLDCTANANLLLLKHAGFLFVVSKSHLDTVLSPEQKQEWTFRLFNSTSIETTVVTVDGKENFLVPSLDLLFIDDFPFGNYMRQSSSNMKNRLFDPLECASVVSSLPQISTISPSIPITPSSHQKTSKNSPKDFSFSTAVPSTSPLGPVSYLNNLHVTEDDFDFFDQPKMQIMVESKEEAIPAKELPIPANAIEEHGKSEKILPLRYSGSMFHPLNTVSISKYSAYYTGNPYEYTPTESNLTHTCLNCNEKFKVQNFSFSTLLSPMDFHKCPLKLPLNPVLANDINENENKCTDSQCFNLSLFKPLDRYTSTLLQELQNMKRIARLRKTYPICWNCTSFDETFQFVADQFTLNRLQISVDYLLNSHGFEKFDSERQLCSKYSKFNVKRKVAPQSKPSQTSNIIMQHPSIWFTSTPTHCESTKFRIDDDSECIEACRNLIS